MILYGKKPMYKKIIYALENFHYLTKRELQGVCTNSLDYTDTHFCTALCFHLTSAEIGINENEVGLLYIYRDRNKLKSLTDKYVSVKRAMAKILIELNIKHNIGIKNYCFKNCKARDDFYLYIESRVKGKSVNFCIYYISQTSLKGTFDKSALLSFLEQHNKEDKIIFIADNISYLKEIAVITNEYGYINNIANTYILPDDEELIKNIYITEQYTIVPKK